MQKCYPCVRTADRAGVVRGGGLRGGGYVGDVLAPVTFALVYAFYLAPAALLPGAIARAWRGEGYSKPRRRVNPNPNPEATAEEARARKAWTVIGVVAMGISLTTGSDVPVFLCFFAQLFKADPSKLMQVMIDKGEPARAEMDQAIHWARALGTTPRTLCNNNMLLVIGPCYFWFITYTPGPTIKIM